MATVIDFETISSQLDPLHLQDIQNPEHPSYYFSTDSYDLLIVRFFEIEKDELHGVSIPYIIQEDKIFKYDRITNKFTVYNTFHEMLRSIELRSKKAERLVKRYLDEIDNLEDALYSRKIPTIFLDLWFDLKKDLTRIDRMLERIDSVLKEYVEVNRDNDDFPDDIMSNILEHTQRYQRLANLHTIKLDTLYNYYNSLKNDKINNNIYVLTILSGIFLPLNLIVGFFGMNTQNLFFSNDPNGTTNVIILLFMMFIILLLVFPITKVVHRYFLQKVLNKFHIYNNILKKIKKLTKH
ncbi:CorA family divalent cation transporter [Sulfurimonas sp. C5]|uniref:CorA family divalent cation transporter n=1 Tax=Sulfurimonas sp. C5 TaxID=3036947 RepID=UPI0024563D82|nr:CorA family divalent cation transporter [Sulfurimonas sp. C5]MDH4943672.1 CorA family divalent cation transporter [Sulfurimonas sp. C5]